MRKFTKRHFLLLTFACLLGFVFIKQLYDTHDLDDGSQLPRNRHLKSNYVYSDSHNDVHMMDQSNDPPREYVTFDREVPIIWVGGVPRSGTTLARAMLDAHRDIRCGEETRVIPRILGMHTSMMKSQLESQRLSEAKITKQILNDALGAYMLSIITKHGEKAPRLCNKDPFTLRSMNKILEIFPNSKFILMIRDGRATAHSIISRKVTIRGFDTKSYRGCLKDWNRAIEHMFSQCTEAGPQVCLPVQYEDLVLHPKPAMEKVLKFLDVPWDDWVLHHEQTIGKEKGVSLSQRELSTDQVNKPVNTAALTKWVGHIPPDVVHDIDSIAPMLRRLGYDPDLNPPNYGQPDELVAKHTADLTLEEKHERVAGGGGAEGAGNSEHGAQDNAIPNHS